MPVLVKEWPARLHSEQWLHTVAITKQWYGIMKSQWERGSPDLNFVGVLSKQLKCGSNEI